MGPEGTGISKEAGLLDRWPQGGPRRLWSADVGQGFSSPVALDGKVYLFGMKGSDDVLTALEADTGKALWSQSYPVHHKADQVQARNGDNGLPLPDATPTIDGNRIYTYGGAGDLVCRELGDGKLVWGLNILDQTRAKILGWNEASSPLVTDKLVYVQGGRGGPIAIAVDKASGNIAWTSQATGLSGYASPILATVGGQPELIVLGGQTLLGMNPRDGKTLWSYPWKTSYDVNATTPIYRDGLLFISTGYGRGCAMLQLTPAGVKLEWQGKEMACKFQPPVLKGDKLYANSAGRLKCVQWPTGKVIWRTAEVPLGEGGSILLDGDKLIAMSDDGKLSLVQVGPRAAQVVSEVDLFDANDTWATPMIYHGKLYVRGKNQVLCLDVTGK
jgi:outer membrane protein assembly factor BamB